MFPLCTQGFKNITYTHHLLTGERLDPYEHAHICLHQTFFITASDVSVPVYITITKPFWTLFLAIPMG